MVVLNIRDHGGLSFMDNNITHKPASQHDPWQYWLGIAKLKSVFSMTLKASNRQLI